MWSVNIMEYYLVLKKKEVVSHVTTWISLEDMMLSKRNQSEKDKYCGTSLVVHWLRIYFPTQGMWVQSLVRELRSHRP